MSSTAMLALPPAPRPARPRMLMIGTALAIFGGVMLFGALCGIFLNYRAEAGSSSAWVPGTVRIPEIAANMAFATLVASVPIAHWALSAINRGERRNSYLALFVTTVFGFAFINSMAFSLSQMRLDVFREAGGIYDVLVIVLIAVHLIFVVAGLVFLALMGFRTAGGRYSAKESEGIAAAVMFWDFVVAAYCLGVWVCIFQLK